MKIAVSATGKTLSADIDPRFGRCSHLLIVETDDMSFEVMDNENNALGGGAGIQTAQQVAHRGVRAVLTGKTSIVASLAVLAERAAMADCDVDAADLHLVLGPKASESPCPGVAVLGGGSVGGDVASGGAVEAAAGTHEASSEPRSLLVRTNRAKVSATDSRKNDSDKAERLGATKREYSMNDGKTCGTCNDSECGSQARQPGEGEEEYRDRQALMTRLCQIRHKILVLSGKGGVGKSTVAVNLATALALAGKRVGLLDVDIHGPSVPKLLHLEDRAITADGSSLVPVTLQCGSGTLSVISMGFLLRERDDAVVWRGPRKYGVIKQFLKDVEWGELDYLIVDSPPGTGDEPLAVVQLIGNADGAIVVTTPQEIAVQDVRRCVGFCRQVNLPVLGVVENMSGFVCPKCGEHYAIFGSDGGQAMAREMLTPFLGTIPIEPDVAASGDRGTPIVQASPHSETAKAFGRIVRTLLAPELRASSAKPMSSNGRPLRIAVPVTQGTLSSHFGHCEVFHLFDINENDRTIVRSESLTPPPHEPGTFPRWLSEQGATVILAGGMGSRAQSLFEQNSISVVTGVTGAAPEELVRSYLDGTLQSGSNICDH